MLSRWLDTATYAALLAHRRACRAFAHPSAAPAAQRLFDWDCLGRILEHPVRPDVLVTRDGALVEGEVPTGAVRARELLRGGSGLVIRRAQQHDDALALLARCVERELGGAVQLQLFATPAKTRGFSWHYDREEVIILQTLGTKTYLFRENTVVSEPRGPIDFSRLREEVSPLQSCTLQAGDLLYLPSGMWHMGRADAGTALSIMILRGGYPIL